MTDVLVIGATNTSPELRHEIPVDIMDPFLYAEVDGRRVAVVWSIEGDRISAVDPSLEIIHAETFPIDELVRAGVDLYELSPTNTVRMVESLGLRNARVPAAFPIEHADALRAAGVELIPDQRLFDDRRRRKTPLELEGIYRASRAAEAGMAAIASLLARSEAGDGGRLVDGEPLTCELLREAAKEAFTAAGCRGDDLIAAHGPQSAEGHSHGSGRVSNDDVLVCDLFPRDAESACYSDMTRTFTVGAPDPEIETWHRQTRDALELARELVRPGANGPELFKAVCGHYERLGHPTNLSKPEGTVLREGFNHSLGHGVGLEVHEAPSLGKSGHELVVGDVITLEPGLYRHGFGGVRLEDLVVVTENGCETITDFPYDLDPAASLVETAR
ncbi:MAG TPA: M24 family metallopeptidase [Gaiellaceae bacterium]|nr:M24 family metallopeptidase [Gaiellaceae bacterium]